MFMHTCHKLWTEICEIRQTFKGDLIKFCELFKQSKKISNDQELIESDPTKITWEFQKNSQKPVFKCKKLVINTTKCDLCLFLQKMCCKMV